jgi:RNA polymerase sigma factor (sigma-70 family)
MTSDDLSQLLDRCRRNEAGAWAALIDRYAGLVYAIARSHRLDEATCDDVVQVVFATLHRKLESIREPDALPGWIKTSTLRECWRVARTRPSVETVVERPATLDAATLERLEAAQRVREGLDELGGRCRDLLHRLFLSGAESEYQQVAADLGIPVGSIGPTRRRCLEKLGKILDQTDRRVDTSNPARI